MLETTGSMLDSGFPGSNWHFVFEMSDLPSASGRKANLWLVPLGSRSWTWSCFHPAAKHLLILWWRIYTWTISVAFPASCLWCTTQWQFMFTARAESTHETLRRMPGWKEAVCQCPHSTVCSILLQSQRKWHENKQMCERRSFSILNYYT
jgi:hypothetical protein